MGLVRGTEHGRACLQVLGSETTRCVHWKECVLGEMGAGKFVAEGIFLIIR